MADYYKNSREYHAALDIFEARERALWAEEKAEAEHLQTTFEFIYAMKRLRDAIDYAQNTGEFQQARIWSNCVEATYNADINAKQKEADNANEGAKLMYSLATGTDIELLAQGHDEKMSEANQLRSELLG